MPRFVYTARQGPQRIIDGVVEAGDRDSAVSKITALGYSPIDIILEDNKKFKAPIKTQSSLTRFSRRVPASRITFFTEQMYDLVDSGVPLLRALGLVRDQTGHAPLKNIISDMHAFVKDGGTFSDALARHPGVFSGFYVNMVKAGEISGKLKEVLGRLAAFTQKEQEVRSRVQSSLFYPGLICIVGGLTVFVLMSFVIPRLTVMFEDLGETLPLITTLLIGVSSFFARFWGLILALVGTGIFYLTKFKSTPQGRLRMDTLMLNIPIFGNFVIDVETGRFTRTLGTLLESGVTIVPALESVCGVLDNAVLKREIAKATEMVQKGEDLASAVRRCRFIPKATVDIIAVGEETGSLERGLHKLADSYERKSENAVKVMTSLLEPVLILCIGSVVGFIVIAMLLPLFRMNLIIQ